MHTNTATPVNNSSNTNTATVEKPWRGVFLRGPHQVKAADGRETSIWSVYQGDNEGNPAGRVYEIKDYTRAEKLAQAMSQDRKLELIIETPEAVIAA